MLTYFQAVAIGALQGVTELFPISSLGHSVLVPAWLGGSWGALVTQGDSDSGTPYLAFVVALHVATAVALLVYYRDDWRAIAAGLVDTVRTRSVETPTQRLTWLLVLAAAPVGVLGLLFEHPLRVLFATPRAAGVFLTLNGVVLLAGEALRRRGGAESSGAGRTHAESDTITARRTATRLDTLTAADAVGIGVAQTFALLAGISRSGVSMVGGLLRGLDHEDAAKFSFLLATPVILAAGLLKLPELAGPHGHGILGQCLAGAIVAGVASYLSVRFLERYFKTRTLLPFAVYSVVFGLASVLRFTVG
ncbi:MAG: undecaprenyl-diphosphate phosphatase [Mycobacteriaceae bacterium]|nr:undecaprenyl-diphosphate phosphatase [Mycobacteriaceae bacterium]